MRQFKNTMSTAETAFVAKAAAIFQHAANITDIEHEPLKKASMSEILAVISGITCAGANLISRVKETTTSHPVTILATEAAKLKWDVLRMIFVAGGPRRNPDKEEEGIEKILEFLRGASATIADHQDVKLYMPFGKTPGGTLRDVFVHMENIIFRETYAGENRPRSKTAIETSTYARFPAAYLPKEEKRDFSRHSGCDEDAMEDVPEKKKENGRAIKFRPAAKAQVPVFE